MFLEHESQKSFPQPLQGGCVRGLGSRATFEISRLPAMVPAPREGELLLAHHARVYILVCDPRRRLEVDRVLVLSSSHCSLPEQGRERMRGMRGEVWDRFLDRSRQGAEWRQERTGHLVAGGAREGRARTQLQRWGVQGWVGDREGGE